ncbi:hypothetical protein TWF281_007399 [Arthrobotrys megalospora]
MAFSKVVLTAILMSPVAFGQTATTTPRPSNVQTLWGLCGGLAAFPTPFTRTLCEPSATCNRPNSFYWQCIPAPRTTAPTTTSADIPLTTTGATTTTSASTYVSPTTTSFTTTTDSRLQSLYGQCGGVGWPGATVCSTGIKCSSINPYFAQCL